MSKTLIPQDMEYIEPWISMEIHVSLFDELCMDLEASMVSLDPRHGVHPYNVILKA